MKRKYFRLRIVASVIWIAALAAGLAAMAATHRDRRYAQMNNERTSPLDGMFDYGAFLNGSNPDEL